MRGVNAAGNGGESDPSDPVSPAASAPAAPSGLGAKTTAAGAVTLSWTSPGDLSISRWEYLWTPQGTPFSNDLWTPVPGSSAGTTGHTTDWTLSPTVAHNFKVRAVSGLGAGTASAAVQPRPAAPTATLSKSVGRIAVAWGVPPNRGPPVTGYTVQWKSGAQSYGSARQATVTTTSHSLASLTDGTEYTVRVRAANSVGASDWSAEVAATPGANPPLKPSRPRATAGNAQITLTWTSGGNGGEAITRWQYRRKDGTNDYGAWTDIPSSGPSTTSWTATTLTNGTEYTFRVRAVNAAGDGAESDESNPVTPSVAGPTPPLAPTIVTATPGNRQVTLAWTSGGDGNDAITRWEYQQKAGTNDYGAWTTVPGADAFTTTWTATTLTNGTEYRFKLRAVNPKGDGAESAASPAATPAGPPGAPTDVKVNLESSERLLLAWKPPTDTGGAAITEYWVQWKSGTQGFSPTRQIRAGAAADTDGYVKRSIFSLTNATPYTLRVQAVSRGGAGPWSATATGTPKAGKPDAPEIELARGNARLDVSWSAPAANGSAITGYTVQWTSSSEPWDSTSPELTVTGTSAAITGLTNGTTYFVRVRATNGLGDSGWSVEASDFPAAVPEAPAGLAIRTYDHFLTFGWEAPDANGYAITGYTVQWKSGTEEWDATTRQVATTNTQHTWGSLVNGTTFTYRVRATNALGDSAWSAEFSGTPGLAPLKPTALTATGGDRMAALAWTSGGDGGSPITGWEHRRQTGANTWGDWTDIPDSGAATTGYTVTGLANGASIVFQVRAVNTTGNSPASDAATALLVPAKPAGVTATPASGSVTLAWTNPNNATITSWETRSKTGNGDYGAWTTVPNSGAATTGVTLTRANGGTYSFEVRAVNATGNGTASDEVTATLIPAAPAGFSATPGNTEVHLSWTDPGNSSITSWEYRRNRRRQGWGAWTTIPGSGASTTSHTVLGHDNGDEYLFQIRAVNATGNGDPSPVLSATPQNVTVRLSLSPTEHGEGEGARTVTVTAALYGQGGNFATATTVAVQVGASGDSAVSGTDYAAVSAFNIVIAANTRSATGTFTLTPTDDTLGEASETITVSGSAPALTVTGASLSLTACGESDVSTESGEAPG